MLLAACASRLPVAADTATFIVVRHAEKVDASHDPDLSAAGHARARALAERLGELPLAAAYAGIRTLRFADGPDEVHKNALARAELARQAAR